MSTRRKVVPSPRPPAAAALLVMPRRDAMQIVHPRCCGLDVHKKDVKACALLTHPDGTTTSQVRTFSTMTDGLLALADWLRSLDIQQVAMESTGVYWRPVFNILEAECAVILVN